MSVEPSLSLRKFLRGTPWDPYRAGMMIRGGKIMEATFVSLRLSGDFWVAQEWHMGHPSRVYAITTSLQDAVARLPVGLPLRVWPARY